MMMMMRSIGFILVLALAGATLSPALSKKCSLIGQWRNDLGSEMDVMAVSSTGNFFGTYLTSVSSTDKPISVSPLHGSQQMGDQEQPTFGFTVAWSFSVDNPLAPRCPNVSGGP
ncbi:avidin-like [Alligator mississippiensis]|uniref:Avidin-like n=1 Tax=Alligator mississippiensis TaxID=8496 RepID=A0A151MRI2_ALLMI|nr:avidin-like [Alligator mississippiensis]